MVIWTSIRHLRFAVEDYGPMIPSVPSKLFDHATSFDACGTTTEVTCMACMAREWEKVCVQQGAPVQQVSSATWSFYH